MARTFNGTTERIDFDNVLSTNTQPLTISAWIFPQNVNRATSQFIFNGSIAGGNGTIFLVADNSIATGALRFFRTTSLVAMARTAPANTLILNKWQHIAVISDGSLTGANNFFFVDGAGFVSSTYAETVDGTGVESAAAGNWNIAGRGSDNLRNLQGFLAHLAFWSRALSRNEILQLAQRASPLTLPGNLKFYAPLDGITPSLSLVGAPAITTVGTGTVLSAIEVRQPTRRRPLAFLNFPWNEVPDVIRSRDEVVAY